MRKQDRISRRIQKAARRDNALCNCYLCIGSKVGRFSKREYLILTERAAGWSPTDG